MKLVVSDWTQAHKWLSVQASALGAAVAGAWTLLSPEQQTALLEFIGIPPGAIVAGMFAMVVVGRLAAQSSLEAPSAE